MKLSTKGRYAIIALLDLVKNGSERLVTLVEISKTDATLSSTVMPLNIEGSWGK